MTRLASFTLDSSRLEGVDQEYAETPVEDRGRAIELQWAQGGANQDMELFGYALRFQPAESQVAAAPTSAFVSADYAYAETPIEDRGRALQLEWAVDGAGEDIEVLGYAVRFSSGEDSALEPS